MITNNTAGFTPKNDKIGITAWQNTYHLTPHPKKIILLAGKSDYQKIHKQGEGEATIANQNNRF